MCATPSGSYLRRVFRRYKYLNPLGSARLSPRDKIFIEKIFVKNDVSVCVRPLQGRICVVSIAVINI